MDYSTQTNPQQNPVYQKRAAQGAPAYGEDPSANRGTGQPNQSESFLARQKRLYGQQSQQQNTDRQLWSFDDLDQPPSVQTTPGTAVGSDGRISPAAPQPQQPQQQQPAVQQPVQQAGPQYPVLQPQPVQQGQSVQQGQPAPNQYGQAPNLNAYNSVYQGQQFPVMDPAATQYKGTTFNQFQTPDQQALQAQQNQAASALLANPYSMTDQGVNQMKAKQQEQALAMQRQLMDQNAQAAAQRGVMGGGSQMGQDAAIGNATLSTIMAGNRDIDIQRMQQNRADQIAAMQAADSVMSGQAGRTTSFYNTSLAGQQAQAGDDLNVSQSGQQGQQLSLAQAIAQSNDRQAVTNSGLQNKQTDIGAYEGYRGDLTQNRQIDENGRQANQQVDFNYSNLNSNNNNTMLQWLMSQGYR